MESEDSAEEQRMPDAVQEPEAELETAVGVQSVQEDTSLEEQQTTASEPDDGNPISLGGSGDKVEDHPPEEPAEENQQATAGNGEEIEAAEPAEVTAEGDSPMLDNLQEVEDPGAEAAAAAAVEASTEPTAQPAAQPSSSSEADSDSDSDDDDIGEELAPGAAQKSMSKLLAMGGSPDKDSEDSDDTKSDASEPVEDDEEEEPNPDRPESPTSAEARERRLRRRLTSFDKRQEKFSQMKAAVKTYDVSMEVVIGKWKRLREDYIKLRANSVLESGDDGSLMITRRMTEIGNMCSRTTNADYYIATLPQNVQLMVRKMEAMPRDQFTEARRRNWSQYDRFVWAARMARVLAQACLVRRRLTIEALANGRSMSDKDLLTNSMSKNLRDCLSYCPEYRTKEMRQKILWFLRTNKVYTHLFSSEMEEECTKYVFYEKYQDGRILSLVDRVPEKFYYVISGKIERRKTYELRAGDYDRVFSVITKGRTSDVEQMELQRPKKFTLVTSGVTEVLTLEREDFLQLLKGTGGLPLKFLQGIGIFQEFPCEKFLDSPEAIVTRYFPKDRVILDDITDTPWIHVIKSGSAKVIRKQLVVHYPRNKYSRDRAIGYSKLGSHSSDMQGLTERQRAFRAQQQPQQIQLPPLFGARNPLSHTIGVIQREQILPQQQQPGAKQPAKTKADSTESSNQKLPKLTSGSETTVDAPAGSSDNTSSSSADASKVRRHRPLNMIARELQIPLRSAGSIRGGSGGIEAAVRPQSRPRAVAASKVLLGPEGFPVQRPQREAYVVLDTLRNGDFLGFRNITTLIEGERIVRDRDNVLSLLSDGAEIILISKRFFVQNAANNTMLKAETMARDFASKSEASQSIEAKEDWDMFRAAFVQRMAARNQEARRERQTRIPTT